jgi:streptogramin lyase
MDTVMTFNYVRNSENRIIMGNPYGIAADRNGDILITETDNNSVIRFDTYGAITTVAGNQVAGFRGDGELGTSASLNQPHGIAVDRNGNIFIADTFNHRIRRVDAITGLITTVAGDGNQGFRGDGGSAMRASFRFPRAVAIDNSGNLFIADEGNHRIRKVNGPFI